MPAGFGMVSTFRQARSRRCCCKPLHAAGRVRGPSRRIQRFLAGRMGSSADGPGAETVQGPGPPRDNAARPLGLHRPSRHGRAGICTRTLAGNGQGAGRSGPHRRRIRTPSRRGHVGRPRTATHLRRLPRRREAEGHGSVLGRHENLPLGVSRHPRRVFPLDRQIPER